MTQKRTSKLLALLLAVLMVMSLLPVTALAAPMAEQTEPASGEAGGDSAYEINGDAKPVLRGAAGDSGKKEPSQNPDTMDDSNTYEMAFSDARTIGTLNDLTVFQLTLDGSQYDSILFTKDSSTMTFKGQEIQFPRSVQKSETGGDTIGDLPVTVEYGDDNFAAGKEYYLNIKEKLVLIENETIDETKDVLLYRMFKGAGRTGASCAYLIIEWTPVKQTGNDTVVDKSQLQSILDNLTESNYYYTADDRYNGKETSANGFWADLQTVLTSAQAVLDNANATQEQIDEAVAALTAAKEKLIPRSQINATVLYEQSHTNWRWFNGQVSDHGTETIDASNTSPSSLKAYTDALAAAKAELAKLYYQQGDKIPEGKKVDDPTPYNDSKGAAATNVTNAETALSEAIAGLDYLVSAANAKMAYASLDKLANKIFNPARLEQSDYEPDSWNKFITARNTALAFYAAHKEPGEPITTQGSIFDMVGQREGQAYVDAYRALWNACYEGLTPTKAGTATLCVEDVYGLTAKTVDTASLVGGGYTVDIPAGGMKLGELLQAKLGSNYESALHVSQIDYVLGIFLNGVYVFNMDINSAEGILGSSCYEDILIKPGDEILVARMRVPSYVNMSGGLTIMPTSELVGDIRYLSISGKTMSDAVIELTAGEESVLNAQYSLAMVNGYNGGKAALSGAQVYLSDCYESQESALTAAASESSGAVTDANGDFKLTLYSAEGKSEGWYALNLIDPGEKGGVACGMNALVHVTDPTDLSALRQEKLTALEALRTAYADEFYSAEQLAQIESAYTEAVSKIESAATSGAINAAYETATATISSIQETCLSSLDVYLGNVRTCLTWLPTLEDLNAGRVYEADMPLLEALFGDDGVYSAKMSLYQKNQLKQSELTVIQALEAVYNEVKKGSRTLDPLPAYSVSFTLLDAETGKPMEGADFDLVDSRRNNASVSWNGEIIKIGYGANINSKYSAELGNWTGAHVIESDTLYKDLIYASISAPGYVVDRAEETLDQHYMITDGTVGGDSWLSFGTTGITVAIITPRRDLNIKIYLKPEEADNPDPAAEALAAAKTTALSTLNSAYRGYSRADYIATSWTDISQAYQDAVNAINAATSEAEINNALTAAQTVFDRYKTPDKEKNQGGISGWGEGDPFDAGTQVGTVTVTAANDTYLEGPWTYTFITEENYPIGENDTMMTVILRMLADNGYSWTGTGGNGFGISYLATISKDGKTMGEFSGEPGSGWMGALNEFMVNEGLSQFSVAAGTLGDGDEIKLMFTQNLGADLGGTWGNSDTTLKSLELSSGTLIPGFASGETGNTYDFALKISGSSDSIVVTPHATNINYMVKTFLNEKVTDNTQGNSFYRRREAIPVRPGDVIWVGVGEKAWPSMNKYGAEARAYSGTWYALHVISEDSGADYVNELIGKLPAGSKITYDNYKDAQKQVAVIEQVKAALSSSEQAKVNSLKDVKDKITFYTEIDSVKALLAALPKSANMTDEQVIAARRQIEAADAAYKAMTDEQKGYITVGDVANYNALVERLAKLVPDTTAETITGSEKKPEKDENEVAPAQVAVAPEVVNGEAKAEITAEDVSKAIEEAPDAKALTVTVSTEGADKVEASLPAEAVKAAADAGMGLNVATENGTVKLSAADIKAASGKDLAVSVKQNADGTTTFDVTAGGAAVDAAVKIELPATGDGQVLVIVDADGKETVVKKSVTEDGKVYAEIPAGATVKAVDAEGGAFGDVKDTDWFAGAVEFVTSHGLFQGTGEGFEPNAPMNRAMLATVLYRLEGGKATGNNPFADVPADAWYTDAVIWASENGIVNGTDAGFEPDAPVTREQIATMLYRYVKTLGLDVSGAADLSKFDDGGETSPWAKDAMAWAVSAGLFRGDANGSLNPKGDATRAEVATLLQRLVKLIVK